MRDFLWHPAVRATFIVVGIALVFVVIGAVQYFFGGLLSQVGQWLERNEFPIGVVLIVAFLWMCFFTKFSFERRD